MSVGFGGQFVRYSSHVVHETHCQLEPTVCCSQGTQVGENMLQDAFRHPFYVLFIKVYLPNHGQHLACAGARSTRHLR